MKLDASKLRYLTPDDFRVLQAVDQGSRNHELVPTPLIHNLSGLKNKARVGRAIQELAKLKLIGRIRNAGYDGFKITHNGYDFLALNTMLKRDTMYSVGTRIGVGKESDIYAVSDPQGEQRVLKIHRLGRISFRSVKRNRDYLQNRNTSNWMYLSKLAAHKEFEFMTILYENGFLVPKPFDYSRHCVLMEWIKGVPMRQIRESKHYKRLYSDLMKFIVQLANHGLIHCDFNEFNIIIREDDEGDTLNSSKFIVIDFPQCVSTAHADALAYFNRDVEGIRTFFRRKFNYEPESDDIMIDTDGYGEGYRFAYPDFERDVKRIKSLDIEVKASGFSKKTKREERELENAVQSMRETVDNEMDDGEADAEESLEENELSSQEDAVNSEGSIEEYEETEDSVFAEDEGEIERIISAISDGKDLKVDKLGNYIMD